MQMTARLSKNLGFADKGLNDKTYAELKDKNAAAKMNIAAGATMTTLQAIPAAVWGVKAVAILTGATAGAATLPALIAVGAMAGIALGISKMVTGAQKLGATSHEMGRREGLAQVGARAPADYLPPKV